MLHLVEAIEPFAIDAAITIGCLHAAFGYPVFYLLRKAGLSQEFAICCSILTPFVLIVFGVSAYANNDETFAAFFVAGWGVAVIGVLIYLLTKPAKQ